VKWTFVKRFDSTRDCLDHLEKNNFTSVVTSPHRKGHRNQVLHDADFTAYAKLAVWFGNESRGISDEAAEASDMCIGIPMFGMIESLNLGTSSGIVLYEVTKQRREYQSKYKKRNRRKAIPLDRQIDPHVMIGDDRS
jgi:tRNA (guanosine-2'-O-)-methyltransferase